MTKASENFEEIEKPQDDVLVEEKIHNVIGEGLDEVIENQNEVVPEAVEKAREKEAVEKENDTNVLDDRGYSFDPSIHDVGADGKPLMNSKGFLKRRRGRKKGSTKVKDGTPPPANFEEKIKQTAYICTHGIFNSCQMVFGEDWAPQKNPVDEEKMMVESFSDYFRVKGVADIPPGVALAFSLMMYSARRFTMPKTKSKMQVLMGGLKYKFSQIFNKKGKNKNGAQSNSGDDPTGKNNPSSKTSE